MHTAGLVDFLGRDGYDVRHFYARYPGWRIGEAGRQECRPHDLVASEAIEFAESEWDVATIRDRFRAAVDSFGPDYVVFSDAWNMKPPLAEALRGYQYFLLMQAQECFCPLNNLRLIGIGPTQVEQCPRNQLATPQVCHQCLAERGHHAGALHQHERALVGVGTAEYDRMLRQSFYEAEAVIVLNPITAALVEPYARRVCIVPWGIDPARFPWAADEKDSEVERGRSQIVRDESPGMTADDGTSAVGSEPGEGDISPRAQSDVVPSGLDDEEGRGAAIRFPAFARRALRSRPSRALETADVDGGLADGSDGDGAAHDAKTVVTLFMAAVAGEVIKGFHVAHEACGILRETRSDFELVVTFDPAGQIDEFTRSAV